MTGNMFSVCTFKLPCMIIVVFLVFEVWRWVYINMYILFIGQIECQRGSKVTLCHDWTGDENEVWMYNFFVLLRYYGISLLRYYMILKYFEYE